MINVTKEKITKAVRDALPNESVSKNIDVQHLMFQWWQTGRQGENLRLSDAGKQAFDFAKIEFYDFSIDHTKIQKKVSTEFTLSLRKIKCPFYIGLKTSSPKSAYIRIYDSKIATLITLYGSFHEYLESLENVN